MMLLQGYKSSKNDKAVRNMRHLERGGEREDNIASAISIQHLSLYGRDSSLVHGYLVHKKTPDPIGPP